MNPDTLWHPTAIKHIAPDAEQLTFTGGGNKFVVHTVEGKNPDGAISTLASKDAWPHFMLGLDEHNGRRILYQFIPLNRAGRALQHVSGPETNRANAIQVEVLEFAANAQHWDARLYRYLRILFNFCTRHCNVPNVAHFPFPGQNGYHRLSGPGWVKTDGLVGHCHTPGNDHMDPGNLKIGKVLTIG